MATIVTRAAKGSPLTHVEVDANFTNLNTDKVESSALELYAENPSSPTAPSATGTNAVAIGTGAVASGTNSTALGLANAGGLNSFAAVVGDASGTYGAQGTGSISIGTLSKATIIAGTAVGYGATSTHQASSAFGYAATTTANNQIALGGSGVTARISGAYTLPAADGTNGQILVTNGSGALSFATNAGSYSDADVDTHLNTSTATTGEVLSWSGTDYDWIAAGGGGASAISINIKTADYTVVSGDLGKIIKYAGAGADRTVTLTAGATLGDGFYVTISNANTGADERVVIDPNGTEKFGWSNGPQTITLSRGEMVKIVWDNTNSCWIIGEGGFNLAIRNDINPAASVLVGDGTNAGFAAGYDAQATGSVSVALGRGVATGGTSVALGKGYASGTDSFAAAIADNTSTYGATGANSIAIGQNAKASNSTAVALGGSSNTSSGVRSVTLGGEVNTASAENSYAFGVRSVANKIGQYAFGNWIGQQGGLMVLQAATTNATPKAMSSSSSGASYNNQLILPNNSAYSFSGTIIARQQAADGSNYASWEIKGALLRDANAASTVLGNGIVNKLFATAGASAWAIALTADTTNGCLKVEATGAAVTDIKWVATVNTAEVTYA
jgi:hypothetical protein